MAAQMNHSSPWWLEYAGLALWLLSIVIFYLTQKKGGFMSRYRSRRRGRRRVSRRYFVARGGTRL